LKFCFSSIVSLLSFDYSEEACELTYFKSIMNNEE